MTMGDSIEGSRSLIFDSSNAITTSYSERISMNSCLSAEKRNPDFDLHTGDMFRS